jgi:hypothetical protein
VVLDKTGAPHMYDITCIGLLIGWVKWWCPVKWRGKENHLMAHCFCLTNVLLIAAKSEHTTQYSVLPSVFMKRKVMYKVMTEPNVVYWLTVWTILSHLIFREESINLARVLNVSKFQSELSSQGCNVGIYWASALGHFCHVTAKKNYHIVLR